MSTHTEHDEEPSAAGVGYEPRDASERPIVVSGFFLVLLTAFGFLGGWFFFGTFEELERASRPATSPIYQRNVPDGPRLQADPGPMWSEYEENQRSYLDSYGWIDEARGRARVPVEVAIEAVAERGVLPAWPRGAAGSEAQDASSTESDGRDESVEGGSAEESP